MTLWLVTAIAARLPSTDSVAPGSGKAVNAGARARAFNVSRSSFTLRNSSAATLPLSQPLNCNAEGFTGCGTIAGRASPLPTCSQG